MKRLAKMVVTLNLGFAIIVLAAYCFIGIAFNLPTSRRFLGNGPVYPASVAGPEMPAWSFGLFLGLVVVAMYLFLFYSEKDMRPHRLLCATIGGVGISGLLLVFLPQYEYRLASLSASFIRVDTGLAWYVWGSHWVYAIIGPNED